MDGGRTTERQHSEYSEFFLHNENQSTIEIQTNTSENPPISDGADETGDVSRILVWDMAKTIGRSGGRRAKSVEWKADQPAIGYLK